MFCRLRGGRKENDWRLTNQLNYFKGVELEWRRYSPSSPENDHHHCEFCAAKFMVNAGEGTLIEGYSTIDSYRWVCQECFSDFVDPFGWHVQGQP
jgi:hypothetical protein